MEGDGSDPELPDAGEDSKSENGENAPVHCCICRICREPDIDCFVIACDNCSESFHGDCIGITEKMAKAIREWYCRECREKDPKLEIRYRHKKSRGRHGSESQDEGGGRKRPVSDPELQRRAGLGAMLARGSASPHKASPQPIGATPLHRHRHHHHHHQQQQQQIKRARKCGECEACRRTENCGHCDFCRDMEKFGGPNKIRQKCRLRQCQLRAQESYKDFPSSLSPATPPEALPRPRRPPPTQQQSQPSQMLGRVREDEGAVVSSVVTEPPEATAAPEPLSDGDSALDPDLYQDFCAGAFDAHGLPRMSDTEESPFLDPALRKRAVKVSHAKKRREQKPEKEEEEERYRRHRQKQKHKDKWKRPERADAKEPASLPQCLGPGCVRAARPDSKYCSDDCGMQLAADRIYKILPQRVQLWQQSPCIAEEHDRKLLERIHREQQSARTRLQEMERRCQELEAIILRAKQQAVREDEENKENASDATDPEVFCVSGGHPIKSRVALRHMERCFAKYESQTSFGSMYPSLMEGAAGLFCDVYNPQSKIYCRRLQVLCPEHSRDPKVPTDEVCGCPLVRDVFELTGDFCRLPKSQCSRHYCWEKLWRAEVDLERVRMWHKLDELSEQERKVRTAMANRAGVLALMLHQTIQHDPLTTDLRSSADR